MQRTVRTAFAVVSGLLAAATVHATTFEIDPAHSSAQFAISHLMISTVRGTLGPITGVVTLDDTDLTKSTVQATIDAKGIDTRNAKRDEHLRSPDFFDVEKYPTITFVSTSVEKVSDEKYQVKGDLTMHGVTKPVTLDVSGSPKPMKDPYGNMKLGGVVKTTLNRKDFGINWSQSMDGGGMVVGEDVDVTIDVELTQKK